MNTRIEEVIEAEEARTGKHAGVLRACFLVAVNVTELPPIEEIRSAYADQSMQLIALTAGMPYCEVVKVFDYACNITLSDYQDHAGRGNAS